MSSMHATTFVTTSRGNTANAMNRKLIAGISTMKNSIILTLLSYQSLLYLLSVILRDLALSQRGYELSSGRQASRSLGLNPMVAKSMPSSGCSFMPLPYVPQEETVT